jgi:hypothetical protein
MVFAKPLNVTIPKCAQMAKFVWMEFAVNAVKANNVVQIRFATMEYVEMQNVQMSVRVPMVRSANKGSALNVK